MNANSKFPDELTVPELVNATADEAEPPFKPECVSPTLASSIVTFSFTKSILPTSKLSFTEKVGFVLSTYNAKAFPFCVTELPTASSAEK